MTGYARVSGEQSGLSWVWEVKSVNGRGLDVRARMPPGYDFLDLPVQDWLVVLDLDDQGEVGLCGDLGMFF